MKSTIHTYRYLAVLILVFLCAAAQVFAQATDVHKWNFDFGGGVTPTLNSTSQRLTTGWNFTVGGGYNFNSQIGVIGQIMYDGLGVSPSVLKEFDVPGANAHIWGFTLNPTVRFRTSDRLGFYLIGGPGYYQRTVNFTRPTSAIVTVFDPFFGFFYPVVIPAKVVIGRNTRVGWGGNIGAGITYKMGSHGAKLFTEVRYHYIATSERATQILPITFGIRW
ncbi:MAG: outer membrane beta-barrel protein [Terriglobia bacterium]